MGWRTSNFGASNWDGSNWVSPAGGISFPTQYPGLRIYHGGSVLELCLVAEGDAPSGMGGVVKIHRGSSNFAVYLVETTDPNASPVRLCTGAGTKSIRLKT